MKTINQKGGMQFTTEQLTVIILFVLVVIIMIIVIIPKMLPESFRDAIMGFISPLINAMKGGNQ
jgi:hypothetical protein